MSEKQEEIDWNDFAGDFIKAEYVKSYPAKFVVLGLEKQDDDKTGRSRLFAEIEYQDRTWKFELNKTNRSFLQARFNSPSEVIGKVLVMERIKVRNPKTSEMVWSLNIDNVE